MLLRHLLLCLVSGKRPPLKQNGACARRPPAPRHYCGISCITLEKVTLPLMLSPEKMGVCGGGAAAGAAWCVECAACCVLCGVVCCVWCVVCCFTVSLFFNAPRREQNCSRNSDNRTLQTFTTHLSKPRHLHSWHRASRTQARSFCTVSIPKQRREEKHSAARCCSSLIPSIDPYPFHSLRRCTHFPARS